MELLSTLPIDYGMLGGVALAVFAVFMDARSSANGVRDYILVTTATILAALVILETWFKDSSVATCCAVGFFVGFMMDDVYTNLRTTVPNFVKGTLSDIFYGIRLKIRRFLGLYKK